MRPWRVGLLVDTRSAEELRSAMVSLSSVWGGYYMPILDRHADVNTLSRAGDLYQLDSLYAESADGELDELLRSPGWCWRGRGPWGPFKSDAGLRKGLIKTTSLLPTGDSYVVPMWDASDPNDLYYVACWGAPMALDSEAPAAETHAFLTVTPLSDLLRSSTPHERVGLIQASRIHVRKHPVADDADRSGLYIMRPDLVSDVVDFWNRRAAGAQLVAVPANAIGPMLSYILRNAPDLVHSPGTATVNGEQQATIAVNVWGFGDADADVARAITTWAAAHELTVRACERTAEDPYWFPGLTTPFRSSFHSEFQPGSLSAHVQLPKLPLASNDRQSFVGIVAADVAIHSDVGQDPRMTSAIPPYRRQSKLLERGTVRHGVDQSRVTTDGIALGVQASEDQIRIPFAYNLDVMALLFDDVKVEISQSNEGKFQTRAAEILGGVFSGAMNQPGPRAAIELTATKGGGVTLQELKGIALKQRGAWPDPLFQSAMTDQQYVDSEIKRLLNSGLVVPTMAVHCSHCRVVSYLHPKDLNAVVECEFCGEQFSLALSLALTKPEWRYRLAAHLAPGKVQALLPVLSVLSVLGQTRVVEGPTMSQVLGMEVSIKGQKPVEVDVAVVLARDSYTTVLGEVKNRNRIDANDVANLERLQAHLIAKKVSCVILVGTFKDELCHEEIHLLRQHVERSQHVAGLGWGQHVPVMPLILTLPDLSVPWGSDEHPWRWGTAGSGEGIFGTAIESCRRHLGLTDYGISGPLKSPIVNYQWLL